VSKVTIIDGERSYRLKPSSARKKFRRGGFEWRGPSLMVAIIRLPIATSPLSRPFRFGPDASFTDWAPRDSCGFLVMQLRTSRKQTA